MSKTLKKCSRCKEAKPISLFSAHLKGKYGVSGACLKCRGKDTKIRNRTEIGKLKTLYTAQRNNSKKRNMVLPNYTLDMFISWAYEFGYRDLYEEWVKSGFKAKLAPSPDRIDDYKPYTFTNLRLVTWNENCRKAKQVGIDKIMKRVAQYDLSGNKIREYKSIAEACRVNGDGFCTGNISSCCKGKRNKTCGYKWGYI